MSRFLVVTYDVTDLTEDEIAGLAGESLVQAESSDLHPGVRHVHRWRRSCVRRPVHRCGSVDRDHGVRATLEERQLMIRILAPQTADAVDAGATVVLEMSRETLLGIRTAVEVAYDDPDSTPPDFAEVGAELWQFFMAGKQIDGDFPFVAS